MGNITAGTHDVYRFAGAAGALLTADIIAQARKSADAMAGAPYFRTPANAILSLWRDNGGVPTQIVRSTGKQAMLRRGGGPFRGQKQTPGFPGSYPQASGSTAYVLLKRRRIRQK